ncbi:MAG: 4Fe-4S dicluster domain-containing protein, partial [Wenzhouxiangella sp.]|jgi:cytochrome c oxidase accessory protein FixG|nr:4Fe-4S dicluster domain-containing protein [Wenzhouxiangella sp.]
MREQVCKYMCPYARFQSAMFDADSLVISYDVERGEPRGGRRRDADYQAMGLGDCIDCKACVQVCPTGIDIRDGLQIECIACAACVDVCDEVMDKMGYPRGLVRYTTDNALNHRPTRILRPRIFIYLFALLAIATLIGVILTGREALIADVLRDRTALYRVVDTELENSYSLKLTNRSEEVMELVISVSGLDGVRVVEPTRSVTVSPGQTADLPLTIAAPLTAGDPGMQPLQIDIRSAGADDALKTIESRFFFPLNP